MSQNSKTIVNPVCPYSFPSRKLDFSHFMEFCNLKLGLSPRKVDRDIEMWLEEDHGSGDLTVFSSFERNHPVKFFIVAKESFVLCGLPIMFRAFDMVSGGLIDMYSAFRDGDVIQPGDVVLAGNGPASAILLGERIALNLCAKMSGITTKTKKIKQEIDRLAKKEIFLLETRKTTPGLRLYEKYAVRVAGARNHRHTLGGGAMLKENHLRAFGSIQENLQQLSQRIPILSKIEIEVSNLHEFRAALSEHADVIMLDNFSLADVDTAVKARDSFDPKIKLELSGNLDEKILADVVASGVDYVSMGALIHKAVWVDMSLQLYKF